MVGGSKGTAPMSTATTYSVNYNEHQYFVTVDRRRLGDDRGFDTYEAAKAEADRRAVAQGRDVNGVKYAVSIPGYRRP